MDIRRHDAGRYARLEPKSGNEHQMFAATPAGTDPHAGYIEFQQEYRSALAAHLKGDAGEDALMRAYDLGRRGAAHRLSILNLSEIHHAAMLAVDLEAQGGSTKDVTAAIAKGTNFFCQVLATFEMMYRGYVDTIAQLQTVNVTLKQQATALRLSEERMRMFIKHNPAAVAMLDKNLRYMLFSPRWLADYRLGERDITGLSHYEVFPETPVQWREIHQRCLGGAVDKCDEALFARADGAVDYVRWEIHPWFTDQQEIGGIIMFTEVITARKNQERKIARLSRIHSIMSAVNAAIVRIGERRQLVQEACRIAVEHGNFIMAWIGFAAPGAFTVTPVAWQVPDLERFRSVRAAASDILDETGLVERALKSRKAVVCNDIDVDRRLRFKNECRQRGYGSLAVLPLFVAQQPIGVLFLCATEPWFFDREEMRLLCEMAEDISFALDHLAKEEKINYLAYYDALTELPNRALFFDRLQRQIEQAKREQHKIAMLLLDFERFSSINDTLGRHTGDVLLKQAVGRLNNIVSAPNTLAYMSKACFSVMLVNITSAADVAHMLEKLLHDCFKLPFQINGQELHVAVKTGISMFPDDGADSETIYKNAEIALRKGKRTGEPYVFYRPEMNVSVVKRLTLENRLYKALEREEFALYYQPKVHAATGRMVGMEALLRWNELESDMVLPSAFIPILEETGMILPVGQWIMERAISDYLHWVKLGLSPPPIAVNVSVVQLRQPNFIDVLERIRHQIPDNTHILDLEITESIVMEDIDQNILKLRAAKNMGMKIAIDDFGTGYSSLNYLTKLPIDLLKIDRSFVLDMNQSASGLAIVSAVISLAHSLQMQVIAEGVDDQAQAKLLRLLNCDQLQGYLCSVPLPDKGIEALLAK